MQILAWIVIFIAVALVALQVPTVITVGIVALLGVGSLVSRVVWTAVIGIGILLIRSGLLGAMEQIAYSIACRQLAEHDGLIPVRTEIESPMSPAPAPLPAA
jgi:hypothetical protein